MLNPKASHEQELDRAVEEYIDMGILISDDKDTLKLAKCMEELSNSIDQFEPYEE